MVLRGSPSGPRDRPQARERLYLEVLTRTWPLVLSKHSSLAFPLSATPGLLHLLIPQKVGESQMMLGLFSPFSLPLP